MLHHKFDHIYVLTLSRLTERHRHIASVLNGVDYELFFGVDKADTSMEKLGREGLYSENLAKEMHRYDKGMTPGMVCCALGHVMIYKDMIAKGYNKVLILEDDILPVKTALPLLPQMMQELPANWELLYLGYEKNEKPGIFGKAKQLLYHLQSGLHLLKWNHKMINHLYPRRISPHLATAGYHDCTHAYAITKSGAGKLLELQQPVKFIADNLLAYGCTNGIVRGFVAVPKLFNQLTAFGGTTQSLTEA